MQACQLELLAHDFHTATNNFDARTATDEYENVL